MDTPHDRLHRVPRRFGLLLVAAVVFLTLMGGLAYTVMAVPQADISLSLDPGTAVAILPGESEYIEWHILPSMGILPLEVAYRLTNHAGDIIGSATYPPATGMDVVYTYTLPAGFTTPPGLPFDKYTVEIFYTSTVGLEATATARFFVGEGRGGLRIFKYHDAAGNGIYDGPDTPVPGVEFHITFPPPFSETSFIAWTDSFGEVIFPHLGTATYTVTEIVPVGMEPVTPEWREVTLVSGVTTTVEFGNRPDPGQLEVIKYNDLNGDGDQDAGEPPMDVHVEAAAPCGQSMSGDTGLDGSVSWPGLCVGTWTVTETVPAGYTAIGPTVATASVTSSLTATVTFGNWLAPGTLEVIKFDDLDGNGVQDPGEPPMDVHIEASAPCGQAVSGDTGPDGSIIWTGRCVETWSVTETVPSGFLPTTPIEVTTSITSGLTSTVVFGNWLASGTLRVYKFLDLNGDGDQDPGEPPMDVAVEASAPCGQQVSGSTGPDGTIVWPGRCVGTWTVTETIPLTHEPTRPPTVTTSISSRMTTTVTFGNWLRPGTLEVFKFEDRDGDGVQGGGEPPMMGVTMHASSACGQSVSGATAADGTIVWPGRCVGPWTVSEDIPAHHVATTPAVSTTVVSSGEVTTVTFGNRGLGHLAAHVFYDPNGNGVQDPGETDLSGRDLLWLNEYAEVDTGTSDLSGDELWSNVPVGDYDVHLLPQLECQITTPTPASTTVLLAATAHVEFGIRCGVYLPLLMHRHPLPTPTPTSTPTPTPTNTPTPTPTPTNTPTPTLTPTPTQTPTPLPTVPPEIPIPHPKAIGIDERDNVLYVASKTTASVYVVDGFTNGVVGTIGVGNDPGAVAANLTTRKVYVCNAADGTVSVISMDTHLVHPTIDLGPGSEPVGIGVNPVTNRVYVAMHGTGELAVIDGAGDALMTTVAVGGGPFGVAPDMALNRVYVSTREGGYVAIVDGITNAEIITQRTFVGGEAYGVAIDPVLRRMYVAYAPETLASSNEPSPVREDLEGLALPGNPDHIAVFEIKPGSMGRITNLVAGYAGPDGGSGLGFNPSTGNLFVSNAGENSLSVFNGTTLGEVAKLPMIGNPGCLAINTLTNRVYVSNRSADIVYMIEDVW